MECRARRRTFVGSFLGVLVRRLPEGQPIAWGRSRCEYCGAALAVRDLVPLFSWLAAKGRCRFCGHPLGWFYPGIELAALAVALVAIASTAGRGSGSIAFSAGGFSLSAGSTSAAGCCPTR